MWSDDDDDDGCFSDGAGLSCVPCNLMMMMMMVVSVMELG